MSIIRGFCAALFLLITTAEAGEPVVTNQPCLPPELFYVKAESILRATCQIHIAYPPRALDSAQSGDVWLRVHVGRYGKVDSMYVFDESNPGWGFDSCAIRASVDAKFERRGRKGYWGYVPFEFQFDPEQLNVSSCKYTRATRDTLTIDSYPIMIKEGQPKYPRLASSNYRQGTVWIKACVNCLGEVIQVGVAKSSGVPILDQAATESAWKCKFKPATVRGNPVPIWVTYNVEFKLGGR